MRLCVYTCVVVKGMYTCKTGNFGNKPLYLCLCCCGGYVLVTWLGSVVGLLLNFSEGIKLGF